MENSELLVGRTGLELIHSKSDWESSALFISWGALDKLCNTSYRLILDYRPWRKLLLVIHKSPLPLSDSFP